MPIFSLDCGGGASEPLLRTGIYERARKGQILFDLMKKAVDGFGGPAYNPRLAAAVAREEAEVQLSPLVASERKRSELKKRS